MLECSLATIISKCDLALYIFFEQLFNIHHIFNEVVRAWVCDWILGL